MATNKEILNALELLKDNFPNGELALIQVDIASLKDDQRSLKEDMRELKKQMLDPDDGVIARVNRNSEFRTEAKIKLSELDSALSKINVLVSWKQAVNKALWIMFTAVLGLVIKALFVL
ncbi:hypothetical protein H8D85_00630 [bacterium]|nr:hypothetical protein [bacterium]